MIIPMLWQKQARYKRKFISSHTWLSYIPFIGEKYTNISASHKSG